MHPTLFRVYGFQITTYGLMLAIAFAVASTLIVRRGEREGIPGEFLQNLLVVVMVAALVGARLLHILVDLEYYRAHPLEAVFSREGYVFFGGFRCLPDSPQRSECLESGRSPGSLFGSGSRNWSVGMSRLWLLFRLPDFRAVGDPVSSYN